MPAVFVLGTIFIVYVVVGYPLLLAFLARRNSRPVAKSFDAHPTVSILLPVRNGEPWIARKLESIAALEYPRELVETIVVSDGSEDRTEEIARAFPLERLRVFAIPHGGKAVALNYAIEHATGEILFFTDVRQQLDPESLRNLAACFADDSVGAASGELIIRDGETRTEVNTGLYWKYEKWIRKHLSRIDSVPGATGCIYAMRANLARPLPSETILDDVNLPLGAFFQGYRVILDDTAKAYDYPTSLRTEFRRKVRTLAGVYQTIGDFPALLGPANRMWLHFVSHKLGRLLLPWALLAVLAASFGLPQPWRTAALAAQAAFYGLALADLAVPDSWPLKRLTSPVRVFVVLMLASLCAVSIFFVPRRVLWKETRIAARTTTGPA
jgi:cellulose synthase/poly-beta-1,6-N-acetylglucosamine synthase-like glycosyltransferase